MINLAKKADRVGLGWWPALMLVLSFSIQAGALDFDKEMRRQNYMNVEMLDAPKAGSKPVKPLPSLDESDLEPDYKVELIPAKKARSS